MTFRLTTKKNGKSRASSTNEERKNAKKRPGLFARSNPNLSKGHVEKRVVPGFRLLPRILCGGDACARSGR